MKSHSEQTPMAYAGYCPGCDHMVAASVDRPEFASDNARFVGELVRDGYRVERVTCEAVRQAIGPCACPKANAGTKGGAMQALHGYSADDLKDRSITDAEAPESGELDLRDTRKVPPSAIRGGL